MALPKAKPKPVLQLHVAGTMHHPGYTTHWRSLEKGLRLDLEPDPANQHDVNAVKVLARERSGGRTQIGWIPRTHSAFVAHAIRQTGPMYAEVVSHDYFGDDPYACLLKIDLYKGTDGGLLLSGGDLHSVGAEALVRARSLQAGQNLSLRTHGGRTSVTVGLPGLDLYWSSKDLSKSTDWDTATARVASIRPLVIELLGEQEDAEPVVRSGIQATNFDVQGENASFPPSEWASAHSFEVGPDSGVFDGSHLAAELSSLGVPPGVLKVGSLSSLGSPPGTLSFGSITGDPAIFSIDGAGNLTRNTAAPTNPQPQKGNTMSKFDAILSQNQSAAQTGAIMEAGRIANNQVAKLAAKQLPMMVRGYADTAVGKVIIANLAAQGAKYFRPEDTRLAALTDAMMVQAFQAMLQTVDIEGFVDELLESKDIKRAMSKLPGHDEEDAAPAARARRPAAK